MSSRKRVVIVGGVAGGASAAARARRLSEDAAIVLFERGGYISFANCGLPYHLGGVIPERDQLLVQTAEGMRRRYRVDVRVRTEVVRIDRDRRQVVARDLATGAEMREDYDALILSPGAAPVRPPVPGVDSRLVRSLRSLEDMDDIKSLLDRVRPKTALVVGGGYIGLEMAEALRERGVTVLLVEMAPQVMGPADPEMAAPLHAELALHGVDLRLGVSVKAFRETGGELEADLSTGETVRCGLAILAIGVRPDVALAAEAGLALGPCGGLAVDEHMRTNDPYIWAVGDAVEVRDPAGGPPALVPLAGPASRQGRIAADNVFGRPSVYRGTQGTAVCKVFGLAIAMTGLSEKALRRLGRACEKVYLHPASHASYYPGAAPLSLKILFDPADGRLLGAQAVGPESADKRVDVLAVAIRAGWTVYDLEHAELAYAPPFGSAKDPVNYAGFLAANALRGDVRLCHAAEAAAPGPDQFLLDVRSPGEFQAGTIPGAVNIPVDDLRERLGELPRGKELLVFCQVGLRGYLACRILDQSGFRCRNLSGGYKTYQYAVGVPPKPSAKAPVLKDDAGNAPAASDRPAGAAGPRVVDARGRQCPGPILCLKEALDEAADGETVILRASDPAFPADIRAWCESAGHELRSVGAEAGAYQAVIVKRSQPARPGGGELAASPSARRKTLVVFSGDFDKAVAAFIIANGAASMGSAVTLFFTFWGLNILRRDAAVPVRKSFVERLFGWMMPRGANRLALSHLHMAGLGTGMIKGIMRAKNVPSLPELIASARRAGVRLVACSMTMELMGIRREELVDGVEEGGVALYLREAEQGNVNLFI
jgi:NADPH-dependent 2,4-dienoyl-CoA reductase/sulfur reductase-like enzyme/peroxiredoxin family protein/rhodanese-related sulfurtransferase/TusA-related sulfurtransferase